jgi:tetratricopeptide (TPR) repeat protein
MGDHRGTERQHRAALKAWDPVNFKRVHALTYADLGDSLAAQARADEAIAAWSRALDLADDLASRRTRAAIHSIRAQVIPYRRRAVPGAAELDQRARNVVR